MKKLLLVSLALFSIIAGCTKSSSNKPVIPTTVGLSGTYKSYKAIDTTYNNRRVTDGIETISVLSIYGDTLYTNPGTSHYIVEPFNVNNPYNPDTFDFTLTFSSNTNGTEGGIASIPFTYNIATGEFHDGAEGYHQQILRLNANTIEFIEYEMIGNTYGQVSATYFRKQ